MILDFDVLGGVVVGGVLYGRGTFSHVDGNLLVYADNTMHAIIPIQTPNGGPVLDLGGDIWLACHVPTSSSTWASGGYLAPVTVEWDCSTGEHAEQTYLGIVGAPFDHGARVDGLDQSPAQWIDVSRPGSTHYVAQATPFRVHGSTQELSSYLVNNEPILDEYGQEHPNPSKISSTAYGVFAFDTRWKYFYNNN